MSKERDAFGRHRRRHGQDEPVAANGRDEGQPDPGVAAGRLDEGHPGSKDTPPFGVLDQRDRHPILHAARRVAHLELGDDATGQAPSKATELDHGCSADSGRHVAQDHPASSDSRAAKEDLIQHIIAPLEVARYPSASCVRRSP